MPLPAPLTHTAPPSRHMEFPLPGVAFLTLLAATGPLHLLFLLAAMFFQPPSHLWTSDSTYRLRQSTISSGKTCCHLQLCPRSHHFQLLPRPTPVWLNYYQCSTSAHAYLLYETVSSMSTGTLSFLITAPSRIQCLTS